MEHAAHAKQMPKEIEQRFKRMMGDMSKHLQRAKNRLDSEGDQVLRDLLRLKRRRS
jgi:hypothetical protein